jgi:hypothetical protein
MAVKLSIYAHFSAAYKLRNKLIASKDPEEINRLNLILGIYNRLYGA